MQRVANVEELREAVKGLRAEGKTVGFVPTMGALHAGHLALVAYAKERCDHVVVSVFVNPTQFGPEEDFEAYPRRLEDDAEACEKAGVAVFYTPTEETMYPPGFSTFVQEELLAQPLCGRGRPGHFRGVCTVVAKLLNQVGADVAVFGQKDAQQALVIRRVVRDLDIPVEVAVHPIVREEDGLALSSRNRYLSKAERHHALALRRALDAVEAAFLDGVREAEALAAAGEDVMRNAEGVQLEYLEVLSAETLTPAIRVDGIALVAVAAKVGPARLIDNTVLDGTAGVVKDCL